MDNYRYQKRNKWRAIYFDIFKLRLLPIQAERELAARHDADILQLLPILGPILGLVILLFGAWDYLIDPMRAWAAFAVRVVLVLLGSVAYWPIKLPWTPVQRCGYLFCMHACAIVICEFLLNNGFLYGLTGIAAYVFTASVVTIRVKTFLLILTIPSILFALLSSISMPLFAFLNGVFLYLFSVGLACIIMLIIRSFRKEAFLLEKKLLRISRHDSLTGSCNRGYLAELAEREVALAKRHGRPLAVAMLDIDLFKNVNDTYGHDIGDQAIILLVDTCMKNLRSIDHFGRMGGEEFACVFPETGEAEAMLCAERLRQAIEALCIETPKGQLRFTVSIGVAVLNPSHTGWDTLWKDADTALYCAKREGRNRVALAQVAVQDYN